MTLVPLPAGVRLTRHFHVSAAARKRYGLDEDFVDLRGRVIFADPDAADAWAASINRVRDVERFPESAVSGAELYAAGLLDEALHLLLDTYRREQQGSWTATLLAELRAAHGEEATEAALREFVEAFPTVAVSQGRLTPERYLEGETDGLPNREVVLEEWACLRVAQENPALEGFRDLFEAPAPDLERFGAELDQRMGGLIGMGDEEQAGAAGSGGDLASLLRAPVRSHPTSLHGQLGYVRTRWARLLGTRFEALWTRLLRAADLLQEARARGPAGPPGPAPVPDRTALAGREEVEAYSPDADWMPSVVLVAKSTYVWLDQLARRYGREVARLDHIPDEALDELVRRGFNALWLIGLWERSAASRRIKQMQGQEDAAASAYALHDYRIADDLGGEEAYRTLRDRAAARGLRLASDMVPNHVGLDGRWVIEHPDWFVQLDHPPYPGYGFTGTDLADHPEVEIRLEDHYWDRSDAAVVFERKDARSGERRYIYHGNDGTSMPWNDTAQLDYLRADVREAVLATIVEVARRFPIIRFDAAMTLAKQHVQRLWYPPPGEGGAIPSRSRYGALEPGEFEQRMPTEFWREVVDRVAREAPDTLLLAEAFWMMEGYFVRTLGMHRVYNSAFMNMLKREANGDYRSLMRNVLSFDPRMLQRFVNFMNNPDEDTAIAQFGDGDKAFGVTTLMATLPGLPMFGHGQVEGLREKYGMEYRRARREEVPDERMTARHLREIAPLLRRRQEFAGVERFRLYDVVGEDGQLHEDVFAYSNRRGDRAHLILFHNRYADVRGRVRESVPFAEPPGNEARQVRVSLAEGIGLTARADRFAILRDQRSGLEELHSSESLARDGLPVHLGAFEARVYLDVREVRDVDGRYRRLHDHLGGRRVPDLEEASLELVLAPLHRAFVQALTASEREGRRKALAAFGRELREQRPGTRLDERRALDALERISAGSTAPVQRPEGASEEAGASSPTRAHQPSKPVDAADPSDPDAAGPKSDEAPQAGAPPRPPAERTGPAGHDAGAFPLPEPAWRASAALAASLEDGADVWEALRLGRAVRPLLAHAHAGVEADAWLELVPLLLREPGEAPAAAARKETRREAPDPSEEGPPAREAERGEAALVERGRRRLANDARLQAWLQVHAHEGVRWYHRERFRAWVAGWSWWWAHGGEDPARLRAAQRRWAELERASEYRFERLLPTSG